MDLALDKLNLAATESTISSPVPVLVVTGMETVVAHLSTRCGVHDSGRSLEQVFAAEYLVPCGPKVGSRVVYYPSGPTDK